MGPQTTAEAFVKALDTEEFDAAEGFLAPGCVYLFRGKMTRGAGEIVDSYRAAAAWAAASFDRIRYESALTRETAARFRVRFVDLTDHAGRAHRHVCEQVFTVDGQGRIDRIEHVDLPGEREKLDAFLQSVGVERRAD